MRFSQRLGITAVRDVFQGRSLDEPTRNRLWSAFALAVPDGTHVMRRTWMEDLYRHIWSELLRKPVDEVPTLEAETRATLKSIVLNGEWWEVYDFLEFVLSSRKNGNRASLAIDVDRILEEEWAGFRWAEGRFIEVGDEAEIEAIEQALEDSQAEPFGPVRVHLNTALDLLSDRRDPDYRNSIKESISAVEAATRILSGNPKATLGEALKILESTAPLHGALRSALASLYGYTSDADGIRHALTETSQTDAATAKFMLVICSAFVVYLIQMVRVPG